MWNKWLQISTGIYWRPIFNLLEGRYEILLVNAQHMHAIPGHKTDSKDSDRMRPKMALLQQALQGHLEPHHRFLRRRDPCPARFSEASCWATGAGSEKAPVAF